METAVLTEEKEKESLIKRLCLFFAIIYGIQGLSQGGPSGLFALPISFMLKDKMGFAPEQLAYFRGLVMIPWTIKPLYGLLSDFIPILGWRRRSWLAIAAAIASSAALYLAKFCNFTYDQVLFFLAATALGIAISDVICDAVMIENGKKFDLIHKFQAIQWRAISFSAVISGLAGGFIAKYFTYQQTFLLMAFLPSLIFMAAIFFVPEKRYQYKESEGRTKTEVKSFTKVRDFLLTFAISASLIYPLLWLNANYLHEKTLRFLMLVIPFLILLSLTYIFRKVINRKVLFCMAFLFWWDLSLYISSAPFFFYFTETLGFSEIFMGTLGTLGSAGAVFGSWLYLKVSRKKIVWGKRLIAELSFEKLLWWMLIIGMANILSNFLVIGAKSAIIVTVVFGFIFMFAHLTILVLAGKFCPSQIEGTFFALLMSVINLGASTAERISGILYKTFYSFAPKTLENNFWAQFLVWLGWPTQQAAAKPAVENLFGLYYATGWLIIISAGLFALYFLAIPRFGKDIKEEKELGVLDISEIFKKRGELK